ncbi:MULTISPECIES: hypothetical protein [unclassified Streptomyces]|uniref:hypothetical protein n=1 Tax=unclassified Streptomyces TaxID=2593676 RepID=UPI002E0FCF34|nr:hypothetical protein OG772_19955 [Streptomyces sp. NBC_01321]WSP55680.1 hypothetical protein OG306_15760 [Streptomyces sp. NBC_01241]WSU23583.1 hypothetical protein OG508_23330 [Streptomyces sp. NBC_01108]
MTGRVEFSDRQAGGLMRVLRVVLWGVGLVALVGLFFSLKSGLPKAVWILCIVLAVACPTAAEGRSAWQTPGARRAEQRDWYAQNFGSIDALRQAVDEQGLRRIRDEKGPANAVREVKRQLPRLPLDVAVTLVKAL